MSDDDKRWSVEVPGDGWHDVGAEKASVEGGALVFYDSEGDVLVAYSVNGWKSVTR